MTFVAAILSSLDGRVNHKSKIWKERSLIFIILKVITYSGINKGKKCTADRQKKNKDWQFRLFFTLFGFMFLA